MSILSASQENGDLPLVHFLSNPQNITPVGHNFFLSEFSFIFSLKL